ncbi:MAG: hypothetical protein GC204_18310 [Chloroflexi bacterium]|nr:hypothetical protein [Chloroflexota bacterium]
MRLSKHKIKWLPLLLTFIGSAAVASGLFVAVFTMTRAPAAHEGIRVPNMIYVGANTCYTCHKDQDHNWSQMINAQEIARPLENPQSRTLEVNLKTETVPLLMGASGVSDDVPRADWRESQHYVIATEEGSLIVPSSEPTSKDCKNCDRDATPETSANLPLDTITATCMICHLRQTAPSGGNFANNVRAQYG